MQKYNFDLFADYFQFYVQDETASGIDGDSWSDTASERMLAVEAGALGVGTARNMDVPVTIEITETEPEVDIDDWDHVVECSIKVPSGKIIVAGCTDYFPDAARIELKPGEYIARVLYGALTELSEDRLDGKDHYKLQLWPGGAIPTKTLKFGNPNATS